MKYIADRRLRLAALLLIGAVMQLPATFCGFELCDSGFYMTFYDNIFTNPEAVGYNFMYYLSGIAGGAVSSLTGGSILAMRVFGALCNLLCICCVWRMLRGERGFMPMLLTVILVTAGAWGTPLTFYNDIMTVTLALISLMFLTTGLSRESGDMPEKDRNKTARKTYLLLLLSGAVAGLNTLTRIPNILEILFVAIIPISASRHRTRLAALWLAGWLSGLGAVLLGALLAGHLPILAATIRDLTATAATPGTESSHGLSSLIQAQISSWTTIVRMTLKLVGLAVVYGMTARLTKKYESEYPRVMPAARRIIGTSLCIIAAWMLARADIMTSLTAISLAGCCSALFDTRLHTAAAAALFMILILPLGSDNGIHNAGTIILWYALAVSLTLSCRRHGTVAAAAITAILAASCVAGLVRGGTYFDDTPLSGMKGRIESPSARGIMTSPARARRVNTMLGQLRKHVSPGDTLLVYGSAPMINHLTATIPAIGCSWPELLSPAMLSEKLETHTPPPYIMMMKFKTLGAEWGAPSTEFIRGEGMAANRFHTPKKSEVMTRYIEKKGYLPVIESEDFTLFKRDPAVNKTHLPDHRPS